MTQGFRHELAPVTNDWQTPPAYIRALGPFDLDPCASEVQHHVTATIMFRRSTHGSGLLQDWSTYGSIWLNPPFDRFEIPKWMERVADHGNGMALIYARTCTNWFHDQVFGRAHALYFIRQRVHFVRATTGDLKGKSTAPAVIVCYGKTMAQRIEWGHTQTGWPIPGHYVRLR